MPVVAGAGYPVCITSPLHRNPSGAELMSCCNGISVNCIQESVPTSERKSSRLISALDMSHSSLLLFLTGWRSPDDVQRSRSCRNTNEHLCSHELHLCCLISKHGPVIFMDKVAIFDSTLQYDTKKKIFHPPFIVHFNFSLYPATLFLQLYYLILQSILGMQNVRKEEKYIS